MNNLERSYCGINAWDAAGRGQEKQKIAMWELTKSRYNPAMFVGFNVIVPSQWSYRIDRSVNSDHLMDTMGTLMSNRPRDEYHILGGNTTENLRYCIENGIDIINVSLDTGWNNAENNAQEAAFLAAGGIIVCAAGNDGLGGLSGLARKSTTISVGAVRYFGDGIVREHFSSYDKSGDALDCAGFDCVQGVHDSRKLSGTSFATPWVASLLAYWRADFIERTGRRPTYDETVAFIRGNTTDIDAPGYDQVTGCGVLRLPELTKEPEHDVIEIYADRAEGYVNGEPVSLVTSPININGRIYVGIVDMQALLGVNVNWTQSERKVTIIKER